ncbi:MAG: methyltransferase domain-containing protein [Alphaproteobacteria bacterium]|nr:methyltransferase domain-containing protein [Alphaproteobacteria bacterium]
MRYRHHADVIAELVPLSGKRVLDVGCGDGNMTRLMTRLGAKVTGVECGARQIAKARAAQPVGDERYVNGVAQALPAEDASVDVVVFFNSLHHVPNEAQPAGLIEAARVLKPGGVVYVSEPMAQGSFFALCRLVDDETGVRAHAYATLRDCARFGLTMEREETYIHTVRQRDFASFKDRIVSANPERETLFDAHAADLEAEFRRLAQSGEGGFSFEQPIRVNLLRKTAK